MKKENTPYYDQLIRPVILQTLNKIHQRKTGWEAFSRMSVDHVDESPLSRMTVGEIVMNRKAWLPSDVSFKTERITFAMKTYPACDLIVIPFVLEQKKEEEVVTLLKTLSTTYTQTPILLFTVNQSKFTAADEIKASDKTVKRLIHHSPLGKSAVYFRGQRDYDIFFRNTRYLIYWHGALHFRYGEEPSDCPRPSVPPVLAWLAMPRPQGVPLKNYPNGNIDCLPQPIKVLAQKPEVEKHIAEFIEKAEVITYPEGGTIVAPHNIGGDLFYVLSGKVAIKSLRARGPQSYTEGEPIGMFEIGETPRDTAYFMEPRIVEEQAAVLRIPFQAFVETELLPSKFAFGILYSRLRNYSFQHILKYRKVTNRNLDKGVTNSIPKSKLSAIDNVLRILLDAQWGESQINRRPVGRCVFLPESSIFEWLNRGPTDQYNKKSMQDQVRPAVSLLTQLGAVYSRAVPEKSNRKEKLDGDGFNKYINSDTFCNLFEEIVDEVLTGENYLSLKNEIKGRLDRVGLKMGADIISSYKKEQERRKPEDSRYKTIQAWLDDPLVQYVDRAGKMLTQAGYSFFYIADFSFCYALIQADPIRFAELIEDRRQQLYPPKETDFKESDWEEALSGFKEIWLTRLKAFILGDLQSKKVPEDAKGKLFFSGEKYGYETGKGA